MNKRSRFESEQEQEADFQLDLTSAKVLMLAIDLQSGLGKRSEWYHIGFRFQTEIGTRVKVRVLSKH